MFEEERRVEVEKVEDSQIDGEIKQRTALVHVCSFRRCCLSCTLPAGVSKAADL